MAEKNSTKRIPLNSEFSVLVLEEEEWTLKTVEQRLVVFYKVHVNQKRSGSSDDQQLQWSVFSKLFYRRCVDSYFIFENPILLCTFL